MRGDFYDDLQTRCDRVNARIPRIVAQLQKAGLTVKSTSEADLDADAEVALDIPNKQIVIRVSAVAGAGLSVNVYSGEGLSFGCTSYPVRSVKDAVAKIKELSA